MPGFLLHLGATVMCMHGGQATPTAPNPRVLVNGQPVVTQTAPYIVSGCPFNVSGAPSPCVTGQWITGSMRVLAGGLPVLLQDSQAICTPNATGLIIAVTQTRVFGM
jgi:uncharacterized Zn-binding protein involved in type VI secretion